MKFNFPFLYKIFDIYKNVGIIIALYYKRIHGKLDKFRYLFKNNKLFKFIKTKHGCYPSL